MSILQQLLSFLADAVLPLLQPQLLAISMVSAVLKALVSIFPQVIGLLNTAPTAIPASLLSILQQLLSSVAGAAFSFLRPGLLISSVITALATALVSILSQVLHGMFNPAQAHGATATSC
ncbi:hypothetical protein OC846_004476 [Tilletia horrida]|uniref:Uncharacterized protein n=1 Tax=Tilletia horrida TaxID=155126 RepID=A0AAN6JSS9_9BASI|nr:hypothetical protein OC846_004476 [Tilletia horrida]